MKQYCNYHCFIDVNSQVFIKTIVTLLKDVITFNLSNAVYYVKYFKEQLLKKLCRIKVSTKYI